MGFLDDLFSNSKAIQKKQTAGSAQAKPANEVKEPAEVRMPVTAAAPAAVAPETGSDADFPVAFGYKCNWLCVKSDSPLDVIAKLGLKNAEPSNWDRGIEMAYNGYRFVSPALDGYVLVVNFGMDVLTLAPELLDNAAKIFPEVQFFVTQRVSDYHAWAKYENGEMIRGYGWCGCDGTVFLNRGDITPEERRLGFTNLLPNEQADWETHDTPDEDYVLELAAAWGIDTSFSAKQYPRSMGYICR